MTENQGERPEDRTPEEPQVGGEAVWQPPRPTTPASEGYPQPARPAAGPQAPAPQAQMPQTSIPPRPQAPYGQYAFGPGAPTGTQQTVPLGDSAAPAGRQKVGAGKVVGIMVAAAIVGGAAGLGGAYAGASLFSTSSSTTEVPTTQAVGTDTRSPNKINLNFSYM